MFICAFEDERKNKNKPQVIPEWRSPFVARSFSERVSLFDWNAGRGIPADAKNSMQIWKRSYPSAFSYPEVQVRDLQVVENAKWKVCYRFSLPKSYCTSTILVRVDSLAIFT